MQQVHDFRSQSHARRARQGHRPTGQKALPLLKADATGNVREYAVDGVAVCKAELLEQLDLALEVGLLLWRRDAGIDVSLTFHILVEELVDIFLIVVIVAIGHNVDTDNPCLDVFRSVGLETCKTRRTS